MRKVTQTSSTNLWFGCAKTSGRTVRFDLFIHLVSWGEVRAVYGYTTFTTSFAHFLYSVFLFFKYYLTPVIVSLFHTIHSTYNYTLFGKKNTFIIKAVGNQEAA